METTLIKLSAVKKLYGVGQDTVEKWVMEGLPRYVDGPKRIYYDKNEIDQHIKKKIERV